MSNRKKSSNEKKLYKALNLFIQEGWIGEHYKKDHTIVLYFPNESMELTVKKELHLDRCEMVYSIVSLFEDFYLSDSEKKSLRTNKIRKEIEDVRLRKTIALSLMKKYKGEYKKKEFERYKERQKNVF